VSRMIATRPGSPARLIKRSLANLTKHDIG
jgi:hypothetical protein